MEYASMSDPVKDVFGHRYGPRRDPWTSTLCVLLVLLVGLAAVRFLLPGAIEQARYAWLRGQLRAEYELSTDQLQRVSLKSLEETSQLVSQRVGPSVVHIEAIASMGFDDATLQRLQRLGHTPLLSPEQGSGFVVSQDGYIVTNHHVVKDASTIQVTLSDGRLLTAKVIGADPLTDLALLKVDAEGLLPIAWGDSEDSTVGSPVWAVGSPFGLDSTVTFGILSGKHRVLGDRSNLLGPATGESAGTAFQDFLQSDVAVNPGNSGGPLVNAKGELIGINTAIVGKVYSGVSFAIPSRVAQQVYDTLRRTGSMQRGWLGVQFALRPDSLGTSPLPGATVVDITSDDSPAAMAGIRPGDRIITFDGQDIADRNALMRRIAETPAGTQVMLGVKRKNIDLSLQVMLGSRPSEDAIEAARRVP
jgi:serine protease Do